MFKKYLWEISVSSNQWNSISIEFYQYRDTRYTSEESSSFSIARLKEKLIYINENILGLIILLYIAVFSVASYKKEDGYRNTVKASSISKSNERK